MAVGGSVPQLPHSWDKQFWGIFHNNFPEVSSGMRLQLPTEVTCSLIHPGCLPSLPCITFPLPYRCSWVYLLTKLLAHTSFSPGLILGETQPKTLMDPHVYANSRLEGTYEPHSERYSSYDTWLRWLLVGRSHINKCSTWHLLYFLKLCDGQICSDASCGFPLPSSK